MRRPAHRPGDRPEGMPVKPYRFVANAPNYGRFALGAACVVGIAAGAHAEVPWPALLPIGGLAALLFATAASGHERVFAMDTRTLSWTWERETVEFALAEIARVEIREISDSEVLPQVTLVFTDGKTHRKPWQVAAGPAGGLRAAFEDRGIPVRLR